MDSILQIAEAFGAIAETYDRTLAALVEVSRQNGGDEAAERVRAAIAQGRAIGRKDLQRLAEREVHLFMKRPYESNR